MFTSLLFQVVSCGLMAVSWELPGAPGVPALRDALPAGGRAATSALGQHSSSNPSWLWGSSGTPAGHRERGCAAKEKGSVGRCLSFLCTAKPPSATVHSRKNRSVANQNRGALTGSYGLDLWRNHSK